MRRRTGKLFIFSGTDLKNFKGGEMGLMATKDVKVRTQRNGNLHRCITCLRLIPRGTIVERQTMVDGGDIYQVYICKPCQAFLEVKENHDACFDFWEQSYPQGSVDEALRWYCYKNSNYIDEQAYWKRVKYFGYGDEKF